MVRLVFRRRRSASCCSGVIHWPPPRPASNNARKPSRAGGATLARARGIVAEAVVAALSRATLITRGVPIGDPFIDIACHVVETEKARLTAADVPRDVGAAAATSSRHDMRQRTARLAIPPGVESVFGAARGALPFGFGGQPLALPLAVGLCARPAHGDDGLVRPAVTTKGHRSFACSRVDAGAVLGVGNLSPIHPEAIDPYSGHASGFGIALFASVVETAEDAGHPCRRLRLRGARLGGSCELARAAHRRHVRPRIACSYVAWTRWPRGSRGLRGLIFGLRWPPTTRTLRRARWRIVLDDGRLRSRTARHRERRNDEPMRVHGYVHRRIVRAHRASSKQCRCSRSPLKRARDRTFCVSVIGQSAASRALSIGSKVLRMAAILPHCGAMAT